MGALQKFAASWSGVAVLCIPGVFNGWFSAQCGGIVAHKLKKYASRDHKKESCA